MTTATTPAVTVRRVRPADAARVRALRLEMLADSPLAYLETLEQAAARPHADYQARIARMATGAEHGQFVAERAGVLVAHAGGMAWAEEPGTTVVFAVYVTPDYRGRGVLGDLMACVAGWSRAVGRPRLLVEVVSGNVRALRAYRGLGFVESGELLPHPTVPALTELRLYRAA